MNQFFKLILITLLITVQSCGEKKKNAKEIPFNKILEIDYSYIDLDPDQSFSINSLIYKNGKLYCLDDRLLKIFVYSFNQGKSDLISQILIDKKVKGNINGNEIGFTITDDKIILINRSNVYELDLMGNYQNSYNLYNKGFNSEVGALPITGTNNPIFMSENFFYTTVYPDVNAFDKESLSKAYSLIKFNNESNILSLLDYPKAYKENIYGYNYLWNYSCIDSLGRNIILSFPISDSLYFYNIEKNTLEIKSAKSPYLEKIKEWSNPIEDHSEYTEFFVTNSSYSYIKYNYLHNFYYRFAENGVSEEEYKNGKGWKDKHLLIFDDDLNLLDTLNISDEHLPQISFVTEEGLIISKFLSEDKLGFDLLKAESN
jgi:hypothetical protein